MDDHFVRRVLRDVSASISPGYGDVTNSSNITNTTGKSSCDLLVDDKNMSDGKIPQVLGIGLGVWLVSLANGQGKRYVGS